MDMYYVVFYVTDKANWDAIGGYANPKRFRSKGAAKRATRTLSVYPNLEKIMLVEVVETSFCDIASRKEIPITHYRDLDYNSLSIVT